jgi:hypothetical protein
MEKKSIVFSISVTTSVELLLIMISTAQGRKIDSKINGLTPGH